MTFGSQRQISTFLVIFLEQICGQLSSKVNTVNIWRMPSFRHTLKCSKSPVRMKSEDENDNDLKPTERGRNERIFMSSGSILTLTFVAMMMLKCNYIFYEIFLQIKSIKF